LKKKIDQISISTADPDPYFVGPHESGSFYHGAKLVRKNMIPTVLRLLDYLSLKNDVNVPSKCTVKRGKTGHLITCRSKLKIVKRIFCEFFPQKCLYELWDL
jgi:hypothetical protein